MRIVNKIEHEVMQAEWENWLLDEVAKCRVSKIIVEKNQTESSVDRNGEAGKQEYLGTNNDHRRFRAIRVWLEEYCNSCDREQKILGRSFRANTTL